MRPLFNSRRDQVAQKDGAGIGTRTGRCLANHRAIGFISRFHDGMHLFHIVDIVGWHTIAMLGSMIQQLA
jgi:hypothetical protein